jgi:hypothetical protein
MENNVAFVQMSEALHDSARELVDRTLQPCARLAASSSLSTGMPASIQASRPPSSGRMRRKPCCLSLPATRADEASFGQVQ